MKDKLHGSQSSILLKYQSVPRVLTNTFVFASVIFAGLLTFQLAPVDERIAPPEYHRLPHSVHRYADGVEIVERGLIDSSTSELGPLIYLNSWLKSKTQLASDADIERLMRESEPERFDDPPGFAPTNNPNQPNFYPLDAKERMRMLLMEQASCEDQFEETIEALIFKRKMILFVLASLSLICAAIALRLRDDQLKVDESGIRFPSGMMPGLRWKRRRRWSDLQAISLDGPQKSKLLLHFASGGRASLLLGKLKQNSLEQLFLALDKYAPQAIRSPELVAFRHELFASTKNHGFTQLWEEELNSHFSASNFVALANGTSLQGGRIKTLMHLSSGGLSAVYLAEFGKQMIVLKESVVPPGTSPGQAEKAREMFLREASMLMKLRNNNIARVLDHFKENDRDYLVLEYIPGLTLREYVRRHGPLPEKLALDWTKQIAGILQYLHQQNPPVIHRDLTPDNLILTPEGKIVLIDFGAANRFIGTATGTIVGKQFYISPEQFRGKAEPASDIYSLGGTLHFLVTGSDPEALSVSHPGSISSTVSEGLDDLVSACTKLDPKQRVKSSEMLIQKILELEADGQIQAMEQESVSLKLKSLEEESIAR